MQSSATMTTFMFQSGIAEHEAFKSELLREDVKKLLLSREFQDVKFYIDEVAPKSFALTVYFDTDKTADPEAIRRELNSAISDQVPLQGESVISPRSANPNDARNRNPERTMRSMDFAGSIRPN